MADTTRTRSGPSRLVHPAAVPATQRSARGVSHPMARSASEHRPDRAGTSCEARVRRTPMQRRNDCRRKGQPGSVRAAKGPPLQSTAHVMPPALNDLRPEFRPMIRLAAPVVLAELGWMTMGMVDTLMVGRLGPEAIGAVGVGSSLFMGIVIFAMGLHARARHARLARVRCGRPRGLPSLAACTASSLALALVAAGHAGALRDWRPRWMRWGLTPTVLALTRPYLDVAHLERAAAAPLFGVPPLPAGHGRRAARSCSRWSPRTSSTSSSTGS